MDARRTVVISTHSAFQSDVTAIIVSETLGPNVDLHMATPSAVTSPRAVLGLLSASPCAVIMPLTWPNYMSLFMGEVVQLQELPTKLILWSRTETPREVLLRLYDSFLTPASDPAHIASALTADIVRHTDPDEVRRAIQDILKSAYCFWHPTVDKLRPEPPKYGEYLAAVQDYRQVKLGTSGFGMEETKVKSTNPHIRILAVFANPRGSDQLRLGNEERTMKECIQLSKYRSQLDLRTCPAANVKDLQRALLNEEAEIVQFSGHSTHNGLAFEDDRGGVHVPPPSALANLLLDFAPPLKCVVLNACYSIEQGRELAGRLPYTIVTQHAISDDAAIEFSRGFYDAIGAGRDIPFAFKQGCRAITLACLPETDCPILLEGTNK
jgi:hypothetical protein